LTQQARRCVLHASIMRAACFLLLLLLLLRLICD
jgi:hypothetical protein